MAKAKGIRVNQLAKELGVPSKVILDRCKTEGLGEKVPNHMSLMSIGLAETVREWFAGAGGGVATAVETATEEATDEQDAQAESQDDADARSKATRKKPTAKKGEEGAEAVAEAPAESRSPAPGGAPAVDVKAPDRVEKAEKPQPQETQPGEARAEKAPEAKAPVAEAPAPKPEAPTAAAPATPAAPAPATPATPAAKPDMPAAPTLKIGPAGIAPATPAPTTKPTTPTAPPAAAAAAPAATPAPTRPMGPGARPGPQGGPGGIAERPMRPTVTLNNRPGGIQPPPRAPVPAPTMLVPKPAVIQGPKIVREEQPDHVAAPRRRGPLGPGQGPGGSAPAFVQARTQGGRGVKTSDEDEEEKKKAASKGRSLSARRRGPDGRRGEAEEKLREFTNADLIERRDRLNAATAVRAAFDSHLKKTSERGTHALAKTGAQKGGALYVEEPITIKTLSAALGVKTKELMTKLMRQGIMANVNQSLDHAVASTLALDYGVELEIADQATMEEQLEREFEQRAPEEGTLTTRPPVVTILGHVDHGKTSLLDKIRSANVAAGEAGGITQHTAAWMVQLGEGEAAKRVTFIDTPGHQAFTSMRARGANMTDVVVLVVSAAEGVQPQTVESINHARAAGVPIVVAMNKIDRPDANPDMVLGQLAKENLNPVEWGGDTEVVRTSALTGAGIPELIEILHYQAELLELKADATASARGTVIESRVDEGRGSVATVLIQDGTLKVGDVVLSGPGYGRVRSLYNDRGEQIQEAGPSTPVIVSGLSELPNAGDKLYTVDDLDRARTIAEERNTANRRQQLAGSNRAGTNATGILAQMAAQSAKVIHLIIKGDVQGSVETLAKTVGGQNTEEVKVKVVHAGVGTVNESDIQLAMATRINPSDPDTPNKVAVIGFNVVPEENARSLAEQNHVEIKLYKVIYEIFDDLKKALSGMLEPEVREKIHGHAEVRQVFKVSRVGNIAGCMVTDGHILRADKIRLIRDGKPIVEDLALESLKRIKDDVRDVKAGFECGIKIAGYDDIKIGDRFEAYVKETHERTL